MAWIESHQSLANHPKTKKLTRLIGVPKAQVIGHLHLLWWWALEYAEDGDLSRFEDIDVEMGCEWEGDAGAFVRGLREVGFVDEGGHIHDWHDYAGKLIERRAVNAERMRKAREQHKNARADTKKTRASHVQRTLLARAELPNQTVPNQTVPNQTVPDTTPPTLVDPATPLPPVAEEPGKDVPTSSDAGASDVPPKPFDLLEAMCDEIGQDVSVLSEREKGKQLGIAKRLVAEGVRVDDVKRIVRWLSSQSWVANGTGVDLKLIEGQLGKWQLQGKPDGTQATRASPAGRPMTNQERQLAKLDDLAYGRNR